MYIVYCHTNRVNGKKYVGRTSGVLGDEPVTVTLDEAMTSAIKLMKRRWYSHLTATRKGSMLAFHCAIRKHGIDAFEHEVLEVCESFEQMKLCEVRWIAELHTTVDEHGYNMTKGGDGNDPMLLTEEARAKHREATRMAMNTSEMHARLSAAQKIAQNDPELRARHSETNKRPEVIARKSAAQKAAQARPEVKAHAREVQKVAQNRPEVKARKSEAIRKVLATPEAKAKRTLTWSDPDVKERHRSAVKLALSRPETQATKSKRVQQIDVLTGEVIAEYQSAHEAARLTGVNRGNLCTSARSYNDDCPKVIGGFLWHYVTDEQVEPVAQECEAILELYR